MKIKTCLVTGSSGFLGSLLTIKLLKDGVAVWGVDLIQPNWLTTLSVKERKKFHFISADLQDKRLFNDLPTHFDIVFHFAAPSSIILFNRQPQACMKNTLQSFHNIVNFCVDHKIKLVFPSSGSLYSGVSGKQRETAIIKWDALNSYAKAKYMTELMANSYGGALNYLCLRIFASFGWNEFGKDEFASVIMLFLKEMITGKSPIVFGDGTQKRDFIYQDDVISILLDLVRANEDGVVNIGSGNSISFKNIVKTINQVLETSIEPTYIPKPNNYLETTKADLTILKDFYSKLGRPIPTTPLTLAIKEIVANFPK